jgi:predicted N-acetyltransferase YhbS
MIVAGRAYKPDPDFIRIRDFLNQTYLGFPSPFNWGLERWNYARYFIAPLLGSSGTDVGTPQSALDAIARWEDLVRVWENEAGEIVGVTCIEHPDPTHGAYGEIFVQRHPDHTDLLEEMVAFGETTYLHPEKRRVFLWVYEDDTDLLDVILGRGYERHRDAISYHLEYRLDRIPPLTLPRGFRLQSMEEENDIEKRREIFGRAFNHEDPTDWPSAFAYRELQKAPDYKLSNDLVVIAPDGTYAACCIVWNDALNRIGHLEPLGTRPDYRRMGLATQIQFEGMRRLQAQGATRLPMTGAFEPFYRAVGFEERRASHPWIKQL